jgi:hypothetical protein
MNKIKGLEVLKPVKINGIEFSNYQVNSYGQVFSTRLNKTLKGYITKKGYIDYDLYSNDHVRKHAFGHSIVAQAFLNKPNEKYEINHIDENKLNNNVKNLEYISHLDNIRHGTGIERRAEKLSIPVIQTDINHNYIADFPSLNQTSRDTGITLSSLHKACTYGVMLNDSYWSYFNKEWCDNNGE